MARHGENIRKRKDGRWEGRYSIYDLHSGKRIVHSVYAKTYNQTKKKLQSVKALAKTMVHEELTECSRIYFCTVAQEWLRMVECSKKHSTYTKYRLIYEKHIRERFDNICLSTSDNNTFIEISQEIESSLSSESLRKSVICVLNQIFSYAESHYHTKMFQYSYKRQSTINKPVEVLNQTEQIKLFQYLYDEMDTYKMGIIICISTGLRLGEICSLKWNDIDLNAKVLHINTTVQRIAVNGNAKKTALLEGEPKSIFSKREIPLSEDIIRLLSSFYSDSYTYVINKNKPMEPRTYQNKFHTYLCAAGIEKKNFHTLRHTFATNCISSGADVKSLSEILGHADVKITLNRYVHPTLETKRRHMNSLSAVYDRIMELQQ